MTDVYSNPANLQQIYTNVDEAIEMQKVRRKDKKLIDEIQRFLANDIHAEFSNPNPLFYLPRHLATPSFEALHAIKLVDSLDAKLIIGEDTGGIFVSHNELKLPLGKLSIQTGVDRHNNNIFQNFTVINFEQSQGKPLLEVATNYGISLPELHAKLMSSWRTNNVIIIDETSWIDRNYRHDIKEHYTRTMALACAHSILLEWFTPEEFHFAETVFLPAIEFIKKEFGVSPLVVELVTPDIAGEYNWNSYPIAVLTEFQSLHSSHNNTKNGLAV